MNSRLMLGGNIFGHFTNKEDTETIFSCAKNLGVFAVDTADVYSEGRSETIIGEIVRKDRSKWFIATKIGLYTNESPVGLGRKKNIFQRVKKSLKRLQTDYIDLYQMHHFDPITPLEETIEAFSELQKQGWIRFGGISNYSTEQLKVLSQIPDNGISYHQTAFSITEPGHGKQTLKDALDSNTLLLAYSVLSRGLFSEKYLLGTIPAGSRALTSSSIRKDLTQDFIYRLQACNEMCKKHGYSLLETALHWVLQHNQVRWAIVGVRSPQHLESIVKAVSKQINSVFLAEVEKIWEKELV